MNKFRNDTDALLAVQEEVRKAVQKFPPHTNSAHHHFAVLKEEVDEAWDAIKSNDISHAREEMVQVAAMALRFLVEAGA